MFWVLVFSVFAHWLDAAEKKSVILSFRGWTFHCETLQLVPGNDTSLSYTELILNQALLCLRVQNGSNISPKVISTVQHCGETIISS